MPTVRWTGAAEAVAQVITRQITVFDAASTYRLTINSKTIEVAGDTDAPTTITALVTAWNASSIPEIAEITAAAVAGASDTIQLTGDTLGKSFTVSATVSGGTGAWGAETVVAAATGPTHWSNADNWDTAVPVNGDDVFIDLPGATIKEGLNQSAVTLNSLWIKGNIQVGLPRTNRDGVAYSEYRDTHLQIGATDVTLDVTSDVVRLDFGAVQTSVTVRNTGSVRDQMEAVDIIGTHASNALEVSRGTVSIAGIEGQAATLASLLVSGGKVRSGSNCTLSGATVKIIAGLLETNTSLGTVVDAGGKHTHQNGTITSFTSYAGATTVYNSNGTITTAVVGGVFNKTGDLSSLTITNFTLARGGSLLFVPGTITFTNGIVLDGNVKQLNAN